MLWLSRFGFEKVKKCGNVRRVASKRLFPARIRMLGSAAGPHQESVGSVGTGGGVAPHALLVSDGLACSIAAGELVVAEHERVVVGTRKNSDLECFHWVNTLLGNIKSSIQGTYHGFKFD
jgi:hypothetical protein